jgi:hypothetical protein
MRVYKLPIIVVSIFGYSNSRLLLLLLLLLLLEI